MSHPAKFSQPILDLAGIAVSGRPGKVHWASALDERGALAHCRGDLALTFIEEAFHSIAEDDSCAICRKENVKALDCTATHHRDMSIHLLPDRFKWRVEIDKNGCWIWKGVRNYSGYGQYLDLNAGRLWRAHRFAWSETHGDLDPHLVLDHLCRVPLCANPRHLRQCTVAVNNLAEGSMSISGQNARKTHCIHGHEFTEANTYIQPGGGRHCHRCRRRAEAKYAQKRRKR